MISRKIVGFLLCFFSLHAFSQKTFLITNNDPFRRPNSVSTYAIQGDGSLLLVGQFTTGGNGGGGSGDPSGQGIGFIATTRIVITPDNKFVFATNAPDNTVSGFSVNSSNGLLTLIPGSPFATGGDACQGMGLAVSPDSHSLFAMNTCSQDVTSFRIDGNGALTVVGTRASIGGEGEDIKVTGDGKFVAVSVSGFQRGAAMLSVNVDSSLTGVPGSPFLGSAGFPGRLETNCGGDQLFVLNDGAPSSIDVFTVAADGTLTLSPQSLTIPLPPTAGGLVGMYLSPDGKLLFVSDLFNSASSFHVAADGALTPESSLVPSPNTIFLGNVVTDPSGKFLYASADGNVAAYSVDNNGALNILAASPLSSPFPPVGSFAALPSKSCGTLTVQIKLRPQSANTQVVTFGAKSGDKLDVAILSAASFDAAQVDTTSLTFGHIGSELSLDSCSAGPRDVNGDGLNDLVCRFVIREGGFIPGDAQAVLKGKTLGGTPFVGTAPVSVVP
ncbi:MAG TPA: beta-propeller fold lactonase family protein [Candidatus Angelobacter sp.]|jgi:6-phosphogluconolactonase (cycloisomerase 2 family)